MSAYEMLLQLWQRAANGMESLQGVPFLKAGTIDSPVEVAEAWHRLYELEAILLEEIEVAQHKHWLDAIVYLHRCAQGRIRNGASADVHGE